MLETPDPLRDAFRPLRESTTASASEVARIRAAAARPPGIGRRRLTIGGVGATVLAASAVAIVAVDRGHPGTFVGEAGARELLRAAADAARTDPAPSGWRFTVTTRVHREPYEGRRCGTCRKERALLETISTERLWSGPRGEVYVAFAQPARRALKNDGLLRAVGAIGAPESRPSVTGTHVRAATPGARAVEELGGPPGTIARPDAVPERPAALVRWVVRRQRLRTLAQQRHSRAGQGTIVSSISPATRLSYDLIDLTTTPELPGAQRAAAFEALAQRPGVTAVAAPAAFASPERVAVRVAGADGDGDRMPRNLTRSALRATPARVIVFDRTTHRVVAEEIQPMRSDPRMKMSFGTGRRPRSLRMLPGGEGETRYGTPVAVPGPGLDAQGRRLLDLAGTIETTRDGGPSATTRRLLQRSRDALRRASRRDSAGRG